jgi:hypothetical protein
MPLESDFIKSKVLKKVIINITNGETLGHLIILVLTT